MNPQAEKAAGGNGRPNSASSAAQQQRQPPAGSRYTDRDPGAEADDPKRARESTDPDFSDDIELGNVPLLPGQLGRGSESQDDSVEGFDLEAEDFQVRYDPPFSCMPAGFVAWLRGPSPPHVYHINPWFPKWQAAPAQLVERWVPSKIGKMALLVGGLVFWIGVFFSLLQASVAGDEVLGYGQPVKLGCHHRLW